MIDFFNNFFNKEKAKILNLKDLKRKNFEAIDFYLSDTARQMKIDNTPPVELLPNGMLLADAIQELRDVINLPIVITSGYRCDKLNQVIKGSPNSSHKQFLACDISTPNLTPRQLVLKIKASNIKVHRVLEEAKIVHFQIHPDKTQYQNFYGFAELFNNKWIVRQI